MTDLQGCRLWSHPPELEEMELSKTQKALVGTGLTGPGLDSEIALQTKSQPQLHSAGFDERQLRMLKAQIRNKRADFHEIIDQAVNAAASGDSVQLSTAEFLQQGHHKHRNMEEASLYKLKARETVVVVQAKAAKPPKR